MTRSELIAVLATRFPSLMTVDAVVAVKEILEAIGQLRISRNVTGDFAAS
jgi:hypothetical protein